MGKGSNCCFSYCNATSTGTCQGDCPIVRPSSMGNSDSKLPLCFIGRGRQRKEVVCIQNEGGGGGRSLLSQHSSLPKLPKRYVKVEDG